MSRPPHPAAGAAPATTSLTIQPVAGRWLHESTDGIADDSPFVLCDKEGPGEEDAGLPDEDLGLAVPRTVLLLKGGDPREV